MSEPVPVPVDSSSNQTVSSEPTSAPEVVGKEEHAEVGMPSSLLLPCDWPWYPDDPLVSNDPNS